MYYGDPFSVTRGVKQVYPLSSIIFKVVVEAVIRHWDTVFVGESAGL